LRFLFDSCWCSELPRRDADKALEVKGELALENGVSCHAAAQRGMTTDIVFPAPFSLTSGR
jgi:hypothetical protein